MVVLKHIDVLSAAKIYALIEFVLGVIATAFILVFKGIFSAFFGSSTFIGPHFAITIAIPLIALVFGFVFGAIFTYIYNISAGKIGGIKLNLKGNQLRSVDSISAAKIAAVFGLIAGLIFGIIVGLVTGSAVVLILGIIGGMIAAAVVIFVITVIFISIYNVLAAKWPIIINIKNKKLKSIGAVSYARIEGIFGLVIGFVEGIIVAVFASINSMGPAASAIPYLGHRLGAYAIIVYPIAFFVLIFVEALIIASLYNWFAPRIGEVGLILS